MIVLGHQNPDCDSLCSAIALAGLFNKLGKDATPALQGEPNPEALFLLEQSGLPQPEIRTSVAGEEIFIVDYSDWNQGTADMKKAKIRGIVDHHKLGDITTSEPLECWIWPVGCSATIVYNMYKFHNQTPDTAVAKMMMGAIISDTVNFKGPTTTDIDKVAAKELAAIAGVSDLEAFATAQFDAKSDIKHIPAAELILRDQKVFEMAGEQLAIGQLELTSLETALSKKDEMLVEMGQLQANKGYHSTIVLLTDVNKLDTTALIISKDAEKVAKALNSTVIDHAFELPGVVSRKKQIIPFLQTAFEA
ncbi:manganese-dependent inorganic pyrophosphatase [Psychromonas antarctica]|jgi:manganese-dependent inorganic pyrophosphatase|uniref:manganese-dependent inorganic pyrophosphatase n=1 Tax=Psychromonas antarctica TaxID=67573 RepID=UPI001EE825BF|nr:manganese-dependent inorganic pyrophosphatase [Psychromonas antarctica]MCG6200803.1 manganese-dependent inorganic pyrophosphatase [Psychromonas antarctica]